MIKNIAFYTFTTLTVDLPQLRALLQKGMQDLQVKGTILLAPEGINASLSGQPGAIDTFLSIIFETVGLGAPDVKVGYSENLAFRKGLVKIKPVIVPMPGKTPVAVPGDSAPYITPQDFYGWLKKQKTMVVLDTRNDFEFAAGRFRGSVHLGTRHFSDFESDLQTAPAHWLETPVVTFCTGGIRCEKAAPLMVKKGFREVYQLEGGILNYFKVNGREYFDGKCFVFDERGGV